MLWPIISTYLRGGAIRRCLSFLASDISILIASLTFAFPVSLLDDVTMSRDRLIHSLVYECFMKCSIDRMGISYTAISPLGLLSDQLHL